MVSSSEILIYCKPNLDLLLDIIDNFTISDSVMTMPTSELCNSCFVAHNALLQSTPYSIYNTYYESTLKYIYATCGLTGPTAIPPPILPQGDTSALCLSEIFYTTSTGDTCDTVAEAFNVSSAALFRRNQNDTIALNCSSLAPGQMLCIPLPCGTTYTLQANDTCDSIETAFGLPQGTVRSLNSWVQYGCFNLQVTNAIYGNVICLSPQGGTFVPPVSTPANSTTDPGTSDGYQEEKVAPPTGAIVAPGTTLNCGSWYTALDGDTCASIAVENNIPANLLWLVNPSLPPTSNCTASIVTGDTYCVGPTYDWNITHRTSLDPTSTTAFPTAVPTSAIYTPLGCYSEPSTLDGNSIIDYQNMTLEFCANFCADQYPYFGVQDVGFCYCGINPGAGYAPVNISNCDRACPANQAENCGGDGFFNMFSVSGVAITTSSSTTTSSSLTTITSSSTSSSAVSSPTAAYTYQGCFVDPGNPRALAAANYINHTTMTIEVCASFCTPTYTIFGLEYGGECWCDNLLELGSTLAAETDCNLPCAGDATETCGAGNRLSVYYTGEGSLPEAVQPVIVQSVSPYNYIGCFTEATNERALSSAATAGSTMTVEVCKTFCQDYTLFGVEYSQECYCGDSLNDGSVLVSDSQCNMVCAGNMGEYCGAGNRLLVYSNAT